MKRKERASRSTYRAILSVRKDRDEPSGLYIQDRFFQPGCQPRSHRLLWLTADTLLLTCLMVGLMMLVVTGFSAVVNGWFYPSLVLLCLAVACIFRSRLCARLWPAVVMVLLLGYLLALYLNQDAFLQGLQHFGKLVTYTMEVSYAAEEEILFPGSGGMPVQIFLALTAVPMAFWLGMALFLSNVFLMAYLLIFPLLALLALCGAVHNTAALFLILFGVVLGMAFSQPKKQRRMWGGDNQTLFAANLLRFESVQKKTASAVLAACIVLSVPGFLVVRPLLAVNLKGAEQMSMQLQSGFLNRMLKLLPELTAGQWNLNLEAIGGGVQNGALSSTDGYLLEGVEDLRLTVNRKPQEALFLRGYVGKNYGQGSWDIGPGTTFDGASMNWNTDGSARIYIQNLPFLRTAYALAGSAVQEPEIAAAMAAYSAEPAQLWVERINANDSYTYVPYGVYLNDYYQVESGDGAVTGQKEQEDRYFFFSREDMETVLSAWNSLDNTANVLDRVEESYRAFCQTDCTQVPENLETLRDAVREALTENKWKVPEDLDEVTAWIRRYLAENYDYQLLPPAVPEGMDELTYFLTESKAGNSVHFASAAVMLYRMFGIPARYVVGYEVPASLFTAQANGIFTATIQGDNSQAWAEIYVPGLGWEPKDMTPGVIGTYEEIGPGGEKIEAVIQDPEETEETVAPEPEAVPEVEELPQLLTPAPEGREWTVGEVITLFVIAIAAILTAVILWLVVSRLGRDLGWKFFRRSPRTRILGVFQAFFRRMRRLGLPRNVDSQSETFAQFCEQILRTRSPAAAAQLRPLLDDLYNALFGAGTLTEFHVRTMRCILLASWKRPARK